MIRPERSTESAIESDPQSGRVDLRRRDDPIPPASKPRQFTAIALYVLTLIDIFKHIFPATAHTFAMIVMKFGGTSNQDATAMSNVIRIVKSHLAEQPVVVISAIARATNELEETARTAARGDEAAAREIIARLFERHDGIIDQLLTSAQAKEALRKVFREHLTEIQALIKGISILRELTPRTMDALCSYGERLSSRIIAAGLKEAGVDAVWVDAKDFMITDETFGGAQPRMDLVTAHLDAKVKPLIASGKTPVTQGFIGSTPSGAYTTMGRESSDYSASIIGAAMNAAKVQIWTDVDGILTADPRVVDNPRKLRNMTFEEAFELSYFGAKVLHPATMLPVIEKKIPVEILNSKRDGTGTRVDVARGEAGKEVLKSVAYKKNLTLICVAPHRRVNQYVFWEEVFSVLNGAGITVGMFAASEYRIAFTVDSRVDVAALQGQLTAYGSVSVSSGKASLCLVGPGLRGKSGIADRIFSPLAGIRVYMVSFGASDLNLTVLIDESDVVDALRRLHTEFFDSVTLSESFEPINR
jgi:aspartate kinase